MTVLQLLISTLAIYLPAMMANMAPIVAAKWNLLSRLNRAIDFGLYLHGERILGSHKTWRGLCIAIIAGAVTGAVQAIITHQEILFEFFIGAMMGFGAIIGDALKSFFKRRFHVAPGSLWIPFDQIDFVIGATIAGIFFIHISFQIFITAIIFIGLSS